MLARSILLALLLLAPSATSPTDGPGGDDPGDRALLQRVDLARASWTRNSEPAAPITRALGDDPPVVDLPVDARGVRWALRFDTDRALTARLYLDWRPGPDGLLFELVIDGERLPPPRDGWRPGDRRLVSDLGPRWLGPGQHLVEFVAREAPAGEGALHLSRLDLHEP